MSNSTLVNRRILLNAHPAGLPQTSDFRLDQVPVPAVQDGQLLLRTEWLSLDPYMRNLMEKVGPGYAEPVPLGQTMVGGTVSRVVESRHPQFTAGDLVLSYVGWQDYAISDGAGLVQLGDMAKPSQALGGLGMTGLTAYAGLLDIGQPKAGETLVVAAATGGVGAVVGQIAKLKGLQVVGVAGGADKCRYAVEELGFDACIDHRDPAFAQQLKAACPKGIDIYFENVGGAVFDAVMPLLNLHARIPVCGFIAQYNDKGVHAGPDRLPVWLATLLPKRVRMQGFIVFDYYETQYFADFQRDMAGWIAAGKIKLREDIVEGLEQAPAAFIGLLQGKNFGKLVVKL